MALMPKLEMRQGQALVMTPQLQQAIKLLQLSNLELTAYVEQELERNPILERDEGTAEDGNAPEASDGPPDSGDTPEDAAAALEKDSGFEDDLSADPAAWDISTPDVPGKDDAASKDHPLDTDYENVFDRDGPSDIPAPPDQGLTDWGNGSGGGQNFDQSGEFGLEQTLGNELSLKDHLLEQVNVSFRDPVERMVGAYLVEHVEPTGYLSLTLDQAAENLNAPDELVERVLKQLQTFEPAGVFARDLTECLKLQLADKDRLDPAMQKLVDNLEILAKHDFNGIMKLCGVDAEDVQDMIAEIRALDPKPGLIFDSAVAQPVIPDVFVSEHPHGGWHVELNSETLPKVLISQRYYNSVTSQARDREEKNYLSECMNAANWLVKSLDQRARTILKVSSEIVRQQDSFLALGVEYLRPLNLKTVADAIEMHESTVSRVTANKFIATPRGIFELKYFFTAAIASSEGGEAHSAESVRHKIRALIDEETVQSIYSDDKLVDILKDTGIDIARRTVAKYREAMGIPSSVQRRRSKKMAAS